MMALRRLLALAAAATVVADVVQVAILCDYLEARTAGRQDCDTAIAAVDAINNKTDGIFDELIPMRDGDVKISERIFGASHPTSKSIKDTLEMVRAAQLASSPA